MNRNAPAVAIAAITQKLRTRLCGPSYTFTMDFPAVTGVPGKPLTSTELQDLDNQQQSIDVDMRAVFVQLGVRPRARVSSTRHSLIRLRTRVSLPCDTAAMDLLDELKKILPASVRVTVTFDANNTAPTTMSRPTPKAGTLP